MKARRTIFAGALALASLALTAPADAGGLSIQFGIGGAQFNAFDGGYGWDGSRRARSHALSPRQLRRILRDKGFRNIDNLDRRGAIYQVKATNRRGNRVGLVVNAYNGEILNRYRY